MTVSSVSTTYLGTALLPSINQTQAQLTALATETTTGQYADLGLQLGSQSGYELSLRNTNDLLTSLTSSNNLVSGQITAATNALSSMTTQAQSVRNSLTSWVSGAATNMDLVTTGTDSMQNLVSSANATYAGSYVFGGINSATAPMSSYSTSSTGGQAVASAFETHFGFAITDPQASSISQTDMQTFLSGDFAALFSGSSWTTNWSSASSTNTTAEICPGQTITTSTNANTSAFQNLTQAYTMLSTFGGSGFSSGAQQAVVNSASSLLNSGIAGVTSASGAIGLAQSQITDATSNMSNQSTLLETQIGNLDDVNSSQVATELNTLQTQLETSYQLTAQIQKLSLANYL